MSSNIQDLLNGGTTESISNTSGQPTILPSTDVINLTQQIIAINNDASLTPIQKQQAIDNLSGISYNAVNTDPTINIQGVGQISNTPTPQSTIDATIQNLMYQLAHPSDNPLIVGQPAPAPNQIVTPSTYVLPAIISNDTLPVQSSSSQPVVTMSQGSLTGISAW